MPAAEITANFGGPLCESQFRSRDFTQVGGNLTTLAAAMVRLRVEIIGTAQGPGDLSVSCT